MGKATEIKIWYRAYGREITPVRVVKVGAKFLTLEQESYGKHMRTAIRSGSWNHFPTWQEAKDFLLRKAEHRLERAKAERGDAEIYLSWIQEIEPQ